jgi:hypothetical protein
VLGNTGKWSMLIFYNHVEKHEDIYKRAKYMKIHVKKHDNVPKEAKLSL